LLAASFKGKNPNVEWLDPSAGKSSYALDVTASTSRRTVVGAEGMRIPLRIEEKAALQQHVFWVFPSLAGVIAESADSGKNPQSPGQSETAKP
jgi:hypothetical protein